MRPIVPAVVACSLVLVTARAGLAACGDLPGDEEAVANARAAARATCDCTGATSHGDYVHCVAASADADARAGRLRPRCRAAVVRCAARSTCGRPGSVTCCMTTAAGTARCRIKADARSCAAVPGASACDGGEPSCCDACAGGRCTTTPTGPPASTTTTTTPPRTACQGDTDCDDGNGCTADRCVDGTCEHECVCVGATGTVTCCPGPAAECPPPPGPTWYYTCGDPVCGGHRDQGIPPCSAGETAGAPCSPDGATCDPGSACNQLLVCTTSDPTHGGQCPISRRRSKEDVRYLGSDDVQRLHDALMKFPLATYRYREGPRETHLGFVIDDVEPSPSVDAGRDMVDLYGYTTMAVAALQAQARQIAALEREVKSLRKELRRAQTGGRPPSAGLLSEASPQTRSAVSVSAVGRPSGSQPRSR